MSIWTKVRNAVVQVARPIAAAYTGGVSEALYRAREQQLQQRAQAEAMRAAMPTFPSAGFYPEPQAFAGGVPGFYAPGGPGFQVAGGLPRLPAPGRLPAPRGGYPAGGRKQPVPGPGGGARPGFDPGDIVNLGRAIITGRRTRRYRRQNPMNVKALRRAIRRVKAFRKLEAQVNRILPVRRVAGRASGSPGMITRGEALRALKR